MAYKLKLRLVCKSFCQQVDVIWGLFDCLIRTGGNAPRPLMYHESSMYCNSACSHWRINVCVCFFVFIKLATSVWCLSILSRTKNTFFML